MHSAIKVVHDKRRGCGYRTKKGALYLMGDGLSIACGRMPIPLGVCPCCGHGVKPSRGWTWVDGDALLIENSHPCNSTMCLYCPLGQGKIGKAGLLWIGEGFYPTPEAFGREALEQGISRRISAVPKGFEVGKTWVLLAHRRAIPIETKLGHKPMYTPGIVFIFKPNRIEILCDGTESDEEIEGYLKRGLTPVIVQHEDEYVPIPMFQDA